MIRVPKRRQKPPASVGFVTVPANSMTSSDVVMLVLEMRVTALELAAAWSASERASEAWLACYRKGGYGYGQGRLELEQLEKAKEEARDKLSDAINAAEDAVDALVRALGLPSWRACVSGSLTWDEP